MDRTKFLEEFEAPDFLLKDDLKPVYKPLNELARNLVRSLPPNEISNIVLRRLDELKQLVISSFVQGGQVGTTITTAPLADPIDAMEW